MGRRRWREGTGNSRESGEKGLAKTSNSRELCQYVPANEGLYRDKICRARGIEITIVSHRLANWMRRAGQSIMDSPSDNLIMDMEIDPMLNECFQLGATAN